MSELTDSDLNPWGESSKSVLTDEDLNPWATPEPSTILGELPRGLKAGVQQLRGFGYGVGALAGEATGIQPLTDWAKEGLADVEAKTPKPAVGSFADIGKEGDYVSDTAKYLTYGVASNLPNMLLSLTGGGLGAVAGKKIVGEATKAAVTTAIKRGAVTGAFTSSLGMEAGSIAADQLTETGKVDPLRAMAGAIPAAILDVVPEWYLAKRLGWLGDATGIKGGRIARGVKAGAAQFGMEAPTEAMQSVLERASVPGKSISNAEAWDEYINSFILGGATGGVVGGAGGVFTKETPVQKVLKDEPLANKLESMIAEDEEGSEAIKVAPAVLTPATEAPPAGQPGMPPIGPDIPPITPTGLPTGPVAPVAPIEPEPETPPPAASPESIEKLKRLQFQTKYLDFKTAGRPVDAETNVALLAEGGEMYDAGQRTVGNGFSPTGYGSQANAYQMIKLLGKNVADYDVKQVGDRWMVTPKEVVPAPVAEVTPATTKEPWKPIPTTWQTVPFSTVKRAADEGNTLAQAELERRIKLNPEVTPAAPVPAIIKPKAKVTPQEVYGAIKEHIAELEKGILPDRLKVLWDQSREEAGRLMKERKGVVDFTSLHLPLYRNALLAETAPETVPAAEEIVEPGANVEAIAGEQIGQATPEAGKVIEVSPTAMTADEWNTRARTLAEEASRLETRWRDWSVSRPSNVKGRTAEAKQAEFNDELYRRKKAYEDAKAKAEKYGYGKQGKVAEVSPANDPVTIAHTKLSNMKSHNSANAGKVLDDLEKQRFDVSDAKDKLAEYKDIVREDFDSGEDGSDEYKDSRDTAWEEFLDEVDGIEREVAEVSPAEAAAPVAPTPTPTTPAPVPKREGKGTAATRAKIAEGKVGKQTFKEFLKAKGVNQNIGNQGSRFYDAVQHEALLAEWKGQTAPAAKVIPATAASERTITTPKEQKAYVLDKLDGLITAARERWKAEYKSEYTDVEIDAGSLGKGSFRLETPPAGEEIITIEVPNDGQFKVGNALRPLLTFKRNLSHWSTSTTPSKGFMPPALPSNKPTGKTAAEFEKEAQAEADKVTQARKDAQSNYLYLKDKAIPEADADYTKWNAIQEDLMNQKRTLKSIAAEFYGTAKSFGKSPSGQDVRDRVRTTRERIGDLDRDLRVAETNIRNNYPSLAKEMFGEPGKETTKGETVNENKSPTGNTDLQVSKTQNQPSGISQPNLLTQNATVRPEGNQSDYEILRKKLVALLSPKSGNIDFQAVQIDGENANFIEGIAGIFGSRVQFFQSETPELRNSYLGFVDEVNYPNTVFLNVQSPAPHLQTLGHELMHQLQANDPELYREFLVALNPYVKNTPEYKRLFVANNSFQSDNQLAREFTAEFIEHRFMDQKFWDGMMEKNPTVFSRVMQYIKNMLDKVVEYIEKGRDIDNDYIADINKARNIAINTLSKYSKQHGEGAISNVTTDASYMDAVNKGDTATAQMMVDAAAKRAGYNVGPVWHGSVETGLTTINPDFAVEVSGVSLFSDNEDVSHIFRFEREYGEVKTSYYDEETDEEIEIEPGDLVKGYLKLDNPLILDGSEAQQTTDDTALQQQVVKQAIKDGYDGIIFKDVREGVGDWMEKGTTYGIFNGNQIKSADPVTRDDKGNIIPLSQRFNEKMPDIRFSTILPPIVKRAAGAVTPPPPTPPPSTTTQSASWDSPEPTRMSNFIYTFIDKQIDLRNVVKAIKAAGGAIADLINPDIKQRLYTSIVSEKSKRFLDEEFSPLVQEMAKEKVSIDEYQEYLWNRTAEETNDYIATINPTLPDKGSGITTSDARKYLSTLDPTKKAIYERLAKRTDKMLALNRDLIVGYQLESQDTVDKWAATYKHYAPLFREDIEVGLGTGEGFSVTGPVSRKRRGSERRVVDILAHIAEQRELIISRGEKNKISIALHSLAKMFPNTDFWKIAVPNVIKGAVNVDTGLPVPDLSYRQKDNVVMSRQLDPKTGKIIERGVEFNIRNKQAERMALSLKNIDMDSLGVILGTSAKITRFIASMNTQYNPVFGVVNFARDVQTAMLNLSSTELAGKQKEVWNLTIPALKAIYSDVRARKSGKKSTDPMVAIWEDFREHGGPTGYRDLFRTSEDRTRAIQMELALLEKGGGPYKAYYKTFLAVKDWLSDYNTSMENAVRLSAYKVALDSGMSKDRAAVLAKSLTVDFNRKGQIATQAGALYAFFNANAQGTARMIETLMGPAGKRIIAGGITLGVLQAAMMAIMDYDDDDPPEFVRERNIIIPIGGKKYITIPMPLGLHVLPNIGRITSEWAMGGFKSPMKKMGDLTGVLVESFNPMGASGLSLQTITPTAIDPFAALAENKDWTGKAIFRENFSSLNPTPGFTRTKDTATWFSKQLSWAINLLSGGTTYKPGLFSPTADQIDYLQGQFTGGVGRELNKTVQMGQAVISGEELPTYKIPLVNRFYGSTEGQSHQATAFYHNLKVLNAHELEIKGRRKNREPLGDYMKSNPEARYFLLANKAETSIAKLMDRKRHMVERGADKEFIRNINNLITVRMKSFNETIKRAEGG